MPYPGEHSARVKNPGSFQEDSFRRQNIADGIDIIIGNLNGENELTTQAYRFKVDKFTAKEARSWLKDHDIKFISFEPATENMDHMEAVLKLYGDVGSEVTSQMVSNFIDENPLADQLIVRINSRGGDVNEGWAIFDLLTSSGKKIKTIAEGKVYSIATIIFLAGTEREIMGNAEGLIHNPFIPPHAFTSDYESDDLKRLAELMKHEESKILDFYTKRTRSSREELAEFMKAEKTLDSKEMLRLGFATKIVEPVKAYAYIKPKLMNIMDEKAFFEKLGSKLDEAVEKIKNFSAPKAKALMLTDKDGKELTLEKESGDPMVGDKATPDGTFVMENGKTIVVSGGEITEITEPQSEEMKEANEKIAELETKIADLEKEKTTLSAKVTEATKNEAELETAKAAAQDLVKELSELKNMWKPDTRTKTSATEKGAVDMNRVAELRSKLKTAKTE